MRLMEKAARAKSLQQKSGDGSFEIQFDGGAYGL